MKDLNQAQLQKVVGGVWGGVKGGGSCTTTGPVIIIK